MKVSQTFLYTRTTFYQSSHRRENKRPVTCQTIFKFSFHFIWRMMRAQDFASTHEWGKLRRELRMQKKILVPFGWKHVIMSLHEGIDRSASDSDYMCTFHICLLMDCVLIYRLTAAATDNHTLHRIAFGTYSWFVYVLTFFALINRDNRSGWINRYLSKCC